MNLKHCKEQVEVNSDMKEFNVFRGMKEEIGLIK